MEEPLEPLRSSRNGSMSPRLTHSVMPGLVPRVSGTLYAFMLLAPLQPVHELRDAVEPPGWRTARIQTLSVVAGALAGVILGEARRLVVDA